MKNLIEIFKNNDVFSILGETQIKGTKYLLVVCGKIEKPLEKFIIYLKVGVFSCNSLKVLNCIKDGVTEIKQSHVNVKLIQTDAVACNIKAENLLKIE